MHLCERNSRLRRHAAALLRQTEDAILAARMTRGLHRAAQQTPEQWAAHAGRWATLVEDATQRLTIAEEQALLAEVAAPRPRRRKSPTPDTSRRRLRGTEGGPLVVTQRAKAK
jgi:hypothetical protein